MIISTMNDLPGWQVVEVYGEVFGLTVRSRNAFSNVGAQFKSLVGGELKGMTKNLETSRQEVIQRMAEAAEMRGANAVLAMRFDTSEMGGQWTEICAYGTAVRAVPAVAPSFGQQLGQAVQAPQPPPEAAPVAAPEAPPEPAPIPYS